MPAQPRRPRPKNTGGDDAGAHARLAAAHRTLCSVGRRVPVDAFSTSDQLPELCLVARRCGHPQGLAHRVDDCVRCALGFRLLGNCSQPADWGGRARFG